MNLLLFFDYVANYNLALYYIIEYIINITSDLMKWILI